MEKLPQSYAQDLDRVWMYSDDVEHVVQLMMKTCKRVTIEVPGFKLDSASELPETKKSRFDSLTLEGSEPRVIVRLQRNQTTFLAPEDTAVTRGIASEVAAY